MAVGFPAHTEEVRKYNLHYDHLSYAALNSLNALGWKYTPLSPYQFGVETKLSFWSYGEQMAINIFQDGTVQVQSKCSFPIQWFDWGKNKKNIDNFFGYLDYFLSQYMAQPGG